ncbi:sodium/potassium-transporting ATPase subunit beta-1-like [Spodoptera litura]|uniref:Sodium/potassium-transporting ATPase subunit beta-1-like n=1 Tax=Spodoptera litura TaxID=69820 RepID=A0A9J7DYJ1_SPOLT|nr:sodium/potassium-transporting ATPase subunit beta-1-like [Spodoptera litura]
MANKANGVEEWVRAPPPPGTCMSRFTNAIYNPEENSFLGRTPKRWGIVLTFYLVFYAVLALMFALCMGGLYLTLEETRPTYLLEESLIGANPGVASRPLYETVVLKYSVENSSEYQPYVEQLNDFFQAYSSERWYTAQKECKAEDQYGFPENPCIFVKVNRIIGWQPEYYEPSDLPSDMPEDLVEHIQGLDPSQQKQVWISCEEEKANDTKLEYPWGRGMPKEYYPYVNVNMEYRSPLVAVRLSSPAHNSNIVIRCRAWAKNIIHNKSLKEPSGYTRFQLYVEGNDSGNSTEVHT